MKKTTIYRKPMKENLFEEEFTVNALSAMGNPLEQLSSFVDFEMFRPTLEEVLVKSECKSAAGRLQIDVVLMFKVVFEPIIKHDIQITEIPVFINVYVTKVFHTLTFS